jgi:hypothetical protein
MLVELFRKLRTEGEEGHDAALTLGLLLERSRLSAPDDAQIAMIVGDEAARLALSREERERIVDELVKYTSDAFPPPAIAVWALSKSLDQRTLPHLIRLLDGSLSDPQQDHLAYQALVGVTMFSGRPSYDAVQRAAKSGQGLVKETAERYLELFGSEDKSNE